MSAQARRRALREALIAEAERVIAAGGLPALRARELARAAGCAVGAIYTAFPDLDAVVLAVNLRTLNLFEAALGPPGGRIADAAGAADELVRLGEAYLDFARAHPLRWDALFRHRAPPGQRAPDWYVAEQARLFARIEQPLAALRPDLPEPECRLLARSLFSATHGIVALGLDPQRLALPAPVIRAQLGILVRAMAAGLAVRAP